MQTPAAMNPVWEQNARGFYTAQLMGIQHKTHQAMFDALQKDRQKLYDQASIGKWYASQGADLNKFNSLYNSYGEYQNRSFARGGKTLPIIRRACGSG